MASAGISIAGSMGAFASVPYVGWAVGLVAAYIDSTVILPHLAGNPEEARQPQLGSLPTSEQGTGAPRTFAIGARMRTPAHVVYQSEKVRESISGGSKGGTGVAVNRVYVNALIHLNDRPTSRLLQLIGNGQLILFTDRNLLGLTTENMSAVVDGANITITLASPADGNWETVFKPLDLIRPSGFVRVAGPVEFNDTLYEVVSIQAAIAPAGGSLTFRPIASQSVASLSYAGGTPFSPSKVTRQDNAIGGTNTTLSWFWSATGPPTFMVAKNVGSASTAQVFNAGDIVRVRNTENWGAAGALCRVGSTNYGGVVGNMSLSWWWGPSGPPDPGQPFNNPGGLPNYGATFTEATNPFGEPFIIEMAEGAEFSPEVFPESFDVATNYQEGYEDQGQPRVLVSDLGSGNTSNYRGMATQGLVDCFVSVFGDQLPTNLEAILDIDDEMTWPQAMEAVMQRGGLANTQIDAAAVNQRPFRGAYVRGAVAVARQIQPMLVAGQVLTQDRDGVIVLFDIDNADSVQLENGATFTDFGCRMYGQQAEHDKVQMEDKPQADMPTSIGVRFQDPDNAFTIAYEHFGLRNPGGVDHTNEQMMDLSNMVLTHRDARDLTTTLMRRAWMNRRTYRMTLPAAYLHLLENDLITWTDDTGEAITARIIQRDIGANYVVQITALRERLNLSVVGSPVQTSSTIVPQQTTSAALLLPIAIDAPGIANSEISTPAIRVAVADLSGTLNTATVWESQDGNTYTPVGTVNGTCAMALLSTALTAQTASETYGTSTVSLRAQTVTVVWLNEGSDTLEACTQAQAEAGKNWCAIKDETNDEVEIAAFTTVTDNGDGTFTLGGWLRGLRGTNSIERPDSSYLVLLNQSTDGVFWRQYSGPTPSTLAYKVVPSGGDLATTTAVTVSSPTFANVLPLPIRDVVKTYNATTLMTRFDVAEHWTRQVLPLGTQPPHALDEPFETYRVNIYQSGSTDIIADSYELDSRFTGSATLRDTYFDWSNARATAAGYTPGPTETYYISYQQVGEWGDGPLRFETI